MSFWLEGVAMPAVSVFGLLGELELLVFIFSLPSGNLVSIRILHSRHSIYTYIYTSGDI